MWLRWISHTINRRAQQDLRPIINRIAEVVERRNIGFLDVGAIPTVSTINRGTGRWLYEVRYRIDHREGMESPLFMMGTNRFDRLQ